MVEPLLRTTHTLILGDAERMPQLDDGAVQLIVTSPPYWQLKDYGEERQIGFPQPYEEYLAALSEVWRECIRVLHDGCRMAINIGDQFARSVTYGRYRVIPIHSDIIRACETLGVDFMGSIIWQKVTTCNTTGGGSVMGSFPFPRNGVTKLDYEHILVFKKPGKAPKPDRELKEKARLTTEEWNQYFYGHWYFPGARQTNHIAVFPEELPRRLIRMFTFPGETVLDPFLGSGTTMKVARELGRSSVGFEIHPEFEKVIREKAGFSAQLDLLHPEDEFVVVHALDKPVGRTQQARSDGSASAVQGGFGSVIRRGDSRAREEFHRVAEVSSVNEFRLSSGAELRLAGGVENGHQSEAVRYFRDLVDGRPVYVRYEGDATDASPLVYLHLKNRTCINSKLIRSGFADADESREYRLRQRYVRYQRERGDSNS